MRELKLLRRQVRSAWALEKDLPPAEREKMQWQFLAMQSGVPYLVGKGGANTFFYRIGEKGNMEYLMPDDMFALMDKWTADRYVLFAITKSKKIEKAKRKSKDVKDLLKRTNIKYAEYFIVGLTPEGELVRLYSFKTGLTGNAWVPIKQPSSK